MKRYCEEVIWSDLGQKMVFIGGPRQVGKTTLSKCLLARVDNKAYFNWDRDEDRKAILNKAWLEDHRLIVFDELHKYLRWKRWIKGVYDTKPESQQYLVTGSARLDVYNKGGDSLVGRYHYWRLHPFTLDEVPADMSMVVAYQRLMTVGGFPEPFLSGDERQARRWQRERFARVLREDVRDLERIRDIGLLELFVEALRARVGSLIVLSNIARDLEIAPKTAKSWLALAERLYLAFPIYALQGKNLRSISKPPKVYFYDNADTLSDEGARLENLIATMLLKRLHFIEDCQGYRCQLHFIRDKDGREVDFATVKDGVLEDLIEVKLNDTRPSTALKYYARKLKPKRAIQIVGNLKRPYHKDGILFTNPIDFADQASFQ